MADIQWPKALRNSIKSAKVWDRAGGARMNDQATGPSFVEPYSDDTPTFVTVEFRFTRDEARVFDAWVQFHKMNLLLPLFDFPIELPDTNATTQECRWESRPAQRTGQENQVYTYQGNLLIRRVQSADLDNPEAILAIGRVSGNRDLDRNMSLIDIALNERWPAAQIGPESNVRI